MSVKVILHISMWSRYHIISQTPRQYRRVKQVIHQRLTASSTVKHHIIKGFNVVAMWHPSCHQEGQACSTSVFDCLVNSYKPRHQGVQCDCHVASTTSSGSAVTNHQSSLVAMASSVHRRPVVEKLRKIHFLENFEKL